MFVTTDNSSRLSGIKRSLESHEITRILEAHSPIATKIGKSSVDKIRSEKSVVDC